jgi:hypothetical protein
MFDENDIALAPTDMLINELKARHPEGCIIALQHSKHEVRSSKKDWRICFVGSQLITLKLAQIAVWMHKDEFLKGSKT